MTIFYNEICTEEKQKYLAGPPAKSLMPEPEWLGVFNIKVDGTSILGSSERLTEKLISLGQFGEPIDTVYYAINEDGEFGPTDSIIKLPNYLITDKLPDPKVILKPSSCSIAIRFNVPVNPKTNERQTNWQEWGEESPFIKDNVVTISLGPPSIKKALLYPKHNNQSEYKKDAKVVAGNSVYLALQNVPKGIPIINKRFWIETMEEPFKDILDVKITTDKLNKIFKKIKESGQLWKIPSLNNTKFVLVSNEKEGGKLIFIIDNPQIKVKINSCNNHDEIIFPIQQFKYNANGKSYTANLICIPIAKYSYMQKFEWEYNSNQGNFQDIFTFFDDFYNKISTAFLTDPKSLDLLSNYKYEPDANSYKCTIYSSNDVTVDLTFYPYGAASNAREIGSGDLKDNTKGDGINITKASIDDTFADVLINLINEFIRNDLFKDFPKAITKYTDNKISFDPKTLYEVCISEIFSTSCYLTTNTRINTANNPNNILVNKGHVGLTYGILTDYRIISQSPNPSYK